MECSNDFYFHNYKFKKCSDFDESVYIKGISVYEIIRIQQGIPLFLEQHLNRLFHSIDLSKLRIDESYCDFESIIGEIIKKNNVIEGKLKLVIHFNSTNKTKEKDLLIYFAPYYFPSADEYSIGVQVGICKALRSNPNAKLLNSPARLQANNVIAEKKLFEVILVDTHNFIYEGSRSNIFFIKGNQVITPRGMDVLMGITRNNIMNICKQKNINIVEEKVQYSDLKLMDSIFLSGTSLKVLPVKYIDDIVYDTSNKLLLKLMKLYNELVDKYVSSKLS